MKVLETYRCVTVGNTLDSPSIHYAGNDSYLIHAVISGKWIICVQVSSIVFYIVMSLITILSLSVSQ